jgi:hypothetical protein
MDPVLARFLERQHTEGMALARESDLLDLVPCAGSPPDRYLATFSCRGLVREPDGAIVEASPFLVGIWLHSEYLRVADPIRVVTWLGPPNVWHPNISDKGPFICLGRLLPGTPLADLLHQTLEIVSWNRVTMREDDALNRDACVWARNNRDRFPVDRRPLKRRSFELQIDPEEAAK